MATSVRPLAWRGTEKAVVAKAIFGLNYSVEGEYAYLNDDTGWFIWEKKIESIEAGKAACQEHWEQNIKRALL